MCVFALQRSSPCFLRHAEQKDKKKGDAVFSLGVGDKTITISIGVWAGGRGEGRGKAAVPPKFG